MKRKNSEGLTKQIKDDLVNRDCLDLQNAHRRPQSNLITYFRDHYKLQRKYSANQQAGLQVIVCEAAVVVSLQVRRIKKNKKQKQPPQ